MSQSQTTSQENALATAPIGKLLFSLAVPAITAQVVNMLYNIVDRIYIGHIPEIGTAALTGVGITFPIITLISAFSSLIAMGGAPRASIAMGAHHKERAEEIMGNCFTGLLALSVALTAVFQIFQEPILWAFGASENTIGYAMDYMGIYVWGTVFVQISLGMNMFITSQGFAKTSMLTVIIGAALNILLDPVFIFVFDMGVRGAAIATVFSQAVSAVWVLLFLCGRRTTLKIRPRCMVVRWKVLLPVLGLGVSPFIMQSTESLLSVVLNTSLLKYGGDTAVGAYTVIASIMQVVNLPLQGLTQGAQPITSYNYGAGNTDRVRATFRRLITCNGIYCLAVWGLIQLFPTVVIRLFTDDMSLMDIGAHGARIFLFGVITMFGQNACQQTFMALGQAKVSMFCALPRKVILLIPLALLLPVLFQNTDILPATDGIFLAEPIAHILPSVTTTTIFFFRFRKLLGEIDSRKQASQA